ncbi:hypothetical protein JCM33374_g4672 [Metschnikowia sp. JCM 33374]|nr:hypothetical protein JCM33374_g4672 [Metschnikowia sp. JCM 33374]
MDQSQSIRGSIDQLIDSDGDTADALSQLEISATTAGVSLSDLSSLLDLVFEPTTSSMVRNRILGKCLVPCGDYLIPPDNFSRVLGVIGAPEVYYKNGKQHKSKRFSLPTQQKILQWTINVLPFFGSGLHRVLRRSLPILFGLLSYEFSRPYIVTFIILATEAPKMGQDVEILPTQTKNPLQRSPLRPWHAQLTVDLLDRFPLDASLRALILHFSRLDTTLDLRHLWKSHQVPSLTLSEGGISIPDKNFVGISRLKSQEMGDEVTQEILRLQLNLTQIYRRFERSSKKRKIDSDSLMGTDILNTVPGDLQVSISAVHSISSLISNFENINFINPSSVFAKIPPTNHRFRCLYVSLVLLKAAPSNLILRKLSSALQYHVLRGDSIPGSYNNFSIENFARYGTLGCFKSEFESYLEENATINAMNLSMLQNHIRLIPYFYIAKNEVILPALNRILFCVDNIEQKTESQISKTMKTLDARNVLPQTMANLTLLIGKFDSSNEHVLVDELIMLDTTPSLMFKLVASTHPLIVSEALGFIASIKKLKLSEQDGVKIGLKNSFVMDSINFIWRDMAFKYETGTINQGMYLHPQFLQRMSGLDFFSNSNLISTRSVGSIVQNPSFAYLCAEIVWKLEDMEQDISIRHPGPISEASVSQVQQDPESKWLCMSYQDLKVSLLNHLDAMGFHGLGDLLFTSLKPLVNQRARNQDLP